MQRVYSYYHNLWPSICFYIIFQIFILSACLFGINYFKESTLPRHRNKVAAKFRRILSDEILYFVESDIDSDIDLTYPCSVRLVDHGVPEVVEGHRELHPLLHSRPRVGLPIALFIAHRDAERKVCCADSTYSWLPCFFPDPFSVLVCNMRNSAQ